MSLKKALDSVREFFFGRSRKLDGHVPPPPTPALAPVIPPIPTAYLFSRLVPVLFEDI